MYLGRYLWYNLTTPVINATTLAVHLFYAGSIGLGLLSILNDAASTVAKHKARKRAKAKIATKLATEAPDFYIEDGEDDVGSEDLIEYEKQLKDYEKAYAEYVKNYQEWAQKYGQDSANPPEPRAAVASADLLPVNRDNKNNDAEDESKIVASFPVSASIEANRKKRKRRRLV